MISTSHYDYSDTTILCGNLSFSILLALSLFLSRERGRNKERRKEGRERERKERERKERKRVNGKKERRKKKENFV
jgi:hypothetical protein